MCKFNETPVEIPARFFIDTDKFISEFTWESIRPRICKIILKKNKM
jgi:hypothetical protein